MITGFGNNVVSSLAADITANQTTIQVMPGAGAIFAGLLTYDYANTSNPMQAYAKITLTDAKETVFEICHLTAVSNDTLTVVRAQEGTTAKGWALNDVIGNFATRGSENQFIQIEQLQSGHYISGIAGGTANALTLELPATYFVNGANNWTLRAPLVVYPAQNNTGTTTLQLTMGGKVLGTFPVSKGNNTSLGAGDLIAGVPVVLLYNEKDKRFQAINAITETGAVKSVNTHKPDASGNVELGTAADADTGTSGEKVPLLSTANTWSEVQTFKKDINVGVGGATSVINIGGSQVIRDNGKTGLIITSSSGTITEGGAGIYLRPKDSTDSAMELHGNASGWNVDKLAVTTFSVNGATSLKGGATITNGALIYGEMNSVMNRTENYPNGSYVNGGLVRSFMFGRGAYGDTRGAFTNLYIQEFVGSYNQAVLNLNGFGNDNSWLFRNDGSFHSPGSVGVGNAFMQGDGNIWGTRWNSNGAWLWDSVVGLVNSRVSSVRLSGLVWGGKIGNGAHDWGGGQVITAVHAWENYAINMEFGLRTIQVLINGQWLNVASL
ncbi:hypothetical protein [Klebsiella aerogenes]|uniref:hypothetical protein n=1 Tax=Klebsiella aerogenes TaxID=548 RepID=UPI001D19600C|nr:hypothetical protein [Klebsiella aerogenes]